MRRVSPFIKWGSIVIVLILFADVLLSLFKITEFRNAIEDRLEFAIVVLLYVAVGLVVTLTGIGIALAGQTHTGKVNAGLLYAAIGIGACLLLLNMTDMPKWAATALENKVISLGICMALSCLTLAVKRNRLG